MLAKTFSTLSEQERRKFELIFETYKNYMYAIALSYTKNTHNAEDIVSEACLRIMANLDKVQEIDSPKTRGYLSIITRNIAIDHYHKDKKEILTDETWPFDTQASFEDLIVSKDSLKNYLARLKPNYLHVLIYTYVYDYDDDQIASILAISKDNVRQRRFRGLKTLRKYIEEGESL